MPAYPGYQRRSGGGGVMLVISLIFGAYFINYAFNFLVMPAFVTSINKWIVLVGGILIIFGGINLLRLNRAQNPY